MSRYPFDKNRGLVIVEICLELAGRKIVTKAAIDTGSTFTVVHSDIVHFLGTTPKSLRGSVHVATARGTEEIAKVRLDKVFCMGKSVKNFEVLCHDLPSSARIQGLLGADFLKHFKMTIDYKRGTVELT